MIEQTVRATLAKTQMLLDLLLSITAWHSGCFQLQSWFDQTPSELPGFNRVGVRADVAPITK